jgi:glycosyltransferase involved in cell wall biosynthesis
MHELYTPLKKRPDLALGAGLMRVQVGALMRSAKALFVTTGSRYRAIETAASFIAPARPLEILPICPNALPVPARRPPGRHRLGLFSTLAVGKSFDAVIDAFDEVVRTHADAELVLIGDLGSPSSAKHRALMQRISQSPAASRITVTGKMPLGAIADAVADLDVYLFPMTMGATTRSGTLPLALGAGLPVVTIDGHETDERFVHGDNIYFAGGLDGASFARAALDILADRALADRLSAGAARLYREQMSWPTITDAILRRV